MGVMDVVQCMMMAVLVVVVVETTTPAVTVAFTSKEDTINTATCRTGRDGVPEEGIISIDLTTNKSQSHNPYLARVSITDDGVSRNKSYNKSVAARGWLKENSNSLVNVGLVQSTSLNLEYDGAKCRYFHGVEFSEAEAQQASLPAKVMTWEIQTPPGAVSARIELPQEKVNRVPVFEYAAGKPLDSMEFLYPQQVNDPTMFMWRRTPDGSKLTLIVIAVRDSEIATRAQSFKCSVKTAGGGVYTPCVHSSPLGPSNPSQSSGLQVWVIALIVFICVVVLAVIAILFVYCRRRRRRNGSPNDDATADNQQNEGKETDVEAPMNDPVQASEDITLNDIADASKLGLVSNNTEDPE